MFDTPNLKPKTLKILATLAVIVCFSGLCVRFNLINLREIFLLASTMNRELSEEMTRLNPTADKLPCRVDDRSTEEEPDRQILSVRIPPEVTNAKLTPIIEFLTPEKEIFLDISCANVDLSQLAGIKIACLGLHRNGEGKFVLNNSGDLQIDNLIMANWTTDDYNSLPEMNFVRKIFLASGEINSTSWLLLNSFPNLKAATFHAFEITDNTFAVNPKVEELKFYNCKITGGLPKLKHPQTVTTLSIAGVNLEDWSGIGEFNNVEILDLSNSNFSDLTLLADMKKLKQLYLINCAINDLTALNGRELESLVIIGTPAAANELPPELKVINLQR